MPHNSTNSLDATCHECGKPIKGAHMTDWMYCNNTPEHRSSRTYVCKHCVDTHMVLHQLGGDLGDWINTYLHDADYLMRRITQRQWEAYEN